MVLLVFLLGLPSSPAYADPIQGFEFSGGSCTVFYGSNTYFSPDSTLAGCVAFAGEFFCPALPDYSGLLGAIGNTINVSFGCFSSLKIIKRVMSYDD